MFVGLGHLESEFYGRVGAELASRGHEVAHVTYSRWSARALRRKGLTAFCFPDRMASIGPVDVPAAAADVSHSYETGSCRSIYRTDFTLATKPEEWAVEQTVRQLVAMESIFEEWNPEILLPELGNEAIRNVAHLVALRRGVPALFAFHTIFPNPLRLYVDQPHGRIVPPTALRRLSPSEREQVDRFSRAFLERDAPIRPYRSTRVTAHRARMLFRHAAVRFLTDRDNPYLRPVAWPLRDIRNSIRARLASLLYDRKPIDRPYVYFPLHVTDDYKLERLVPHCADQVALVRQVAGTLPEGIDLVVKEHPLSIGRNRLQMLAALKRIPNVRLVEPHVSSVKLARGARAVVVISSTVGLEALLANRPVLTLGKPFYAGYGVTIDVDDFYDLPDALTDVLRFEPDPDRVAEFLHAAMDACYPGVPVLVDASDENAVMLADSFERAARAVRALRGREAGAAADDHSLSRSETARLELVRPSG